MVWPFHHGTALDLWLIEYATFNILEFCADLNSEFFDFLISVVDSVQQLVNCSLRSCVEVAENLIIWWTFLASCLTCWNLAQLKWQVLFIEYTSVDHQQFVCIEVLATIECEENRIEMSLHERVQSL